MFLAAVTGCELFAPPSPTLLVTVVPDLSEIPYAAQIVCDGSAGWYTYLVNGETVGPTRESTLDVVVDAMDWSATVTWTNDSHSLTRTVYATGSNGRPRITGVRINGQSNLWQLDPMERTLLEPIVRYDGGWRLVSLDVTASASAWPFTVFYPPYESGVCHASWHGWVIENAGIVYPVYCSIDTTGLPYSPTGLDAGYPTSYYNTNKFADHASSTEEDLEIPAQTAKIAVTVEDDFGRLTSASFQVPVSACDFTWANKPQP